MMIINLKNIFSLFFLFITLLPLCTWIKAQEAPTPWPLANPGGEWTLLQSNVGVCPMHMQVLHNNKVVMFDRTDFGVSNLSLPEGSKCVGEPLDCSAHSFLYDLELNTFRPLTVQTDVWCSSGAVFPNGTLIQTGGYDEGAKKTRMFTPCDDFEECDWEERPDEIAAPRWYATDQILPDGRVIVVGGRKTHSYEFFPKRDNSEKYYPFRFLSETDDGHKNENNLYPFLHLLPDGNLYIFANRRSILFDYFNNRIIKEFPLIPGEKRNYPATGSSVLLPLKGQNPEPEVMVCGGAADNAFEMAHDHKVFVQASNSCGRLKLTDPNPTWFMEQMPMSRVMSDMILLPNGNVLLINGASNGSAGWLFGENPVFHPIFYNLDEPDLKERFSVLNPSKIPRMYHSAAVLMPDGRILVGGSNPNEKYEFRRNGKVTYLTELRLEAFSPPYLDPQYSNLRPSNLKIEPTEATVSYGQSFTISFTLPTHLADQKITVLMIAPSFATHSFSMNQRLIYLDILGGVQQVSGNGYKVNVVAPPTKNVAPAGYYMVFVVHDGIPGKSVWVKVVN